MKHHGIEMEGQLVLEKKALPVWSAADEGRIVYDITNDIMYIGGSSDWVRMADDAELGTLGAQDADSVAISGGTIEELTSIKMTNGATIDEFSIDGTFAGDSDTAIPTEKAIVTYVAAYTPINSFPTNTIMLFAQANAPTGWVRDETYAHSTYKGGIMLANTGGSGALTGGSYDLIGKSLSHAHTTGSVALTMAQMPVHGYHGNASHTIGNAEYAAGRLDAIYQTSGTTNRGSGATHNHGNTGSGGISLNPRYMTVIAAIKS